MTNPNTDIDGTTRAILDTIAALGYAITVTPGEITARHIGAGGVLVVRCDADGMYAAACELARMVGIDLEDG